MLSAWLVWRGIKFVALVILVAGLFELGRSRADDERARARAMGAMTVGFLAVWLAGYVLLKLGKKGLGEPWVSWSLLTSLATFGAATALAQGAKAVKLLWALTLGSLYATTFLMVARVASPAVQGGLVGAGLVLGGINAALMPAVAPEGEAARGWVWPWFRALAWAEGVSFIALMFINMPLRKMTGMTLDAGTGALGWLHGALFLVYLVALGVTSRALQWPWRARILGGIASVLPFGTFVFERWVERKLISPAKGA